MRVRVGVHCPLRVLNRIRVSLLGNGKSEMPTNDGVLPMFLPTGDCTGYFIVQPTPALPAPAAVDWPFPHLTCALTHSHPPNYPPPQEGMISCRRT